MKLAPPAPVSTQTPAPSAAVRPAVPVPPARWARWYTSPIATFQYGEGSRMQLWQEARIPADRSVTGSRKPSVRFGGGTREGAIEAARAMAQAATTVEFSYANGRIGSTLVHPAIAVLRDAQAGVFWLAPLQTTVRLRGEWVDAPHTIDGDAFAGPKPVLLTPTVLRATSDLVAIVGRDSVIKPGTWRSAPDDSLLDEALLDD